MSGWWLGMILGFLSGFTVACLMWETDHGEGKGKCGQP